jgi:hypothetical protein
MKRWFALTMVAALLIGGAVSARMTTVVVGGTAAVSLSYVQKDKPDSSYPVWDSTNDYFGYNTTVGRFQCWTTGSEYDIRRVQVQLKRTGTSDTCYLCASIYAEGTNVPTGSALKTTSSGLATTSLTSSMAAYNFDFAAGSNLSTGTAYCVYIFAADSTCSTPSSTCGASGNYPVLGENRSGGSDDMGTYTTSWGSVDTTAYSEIITYSYE